jgi:CheY-like chemotaxis protein
MAASDFVRRMMPRPAWTAWLKAFLILLAAALGCLSLHGATQTKTTTNTVEFAKSLPKPGSVKWELNNRLNKQRQEIYRKRLAIPNAVGSNVPRAATASLVNGPKNAPAPTPAPIVSAGRLLKLLLFSAALALTGVLLARRFAPQLLFDLNQRFNPWVAAPVVIRDYPAQVRAEEAPFGEFVTALRSGPSPSPDSALPEPDDLNLEFYARTKKRLVTQRKLLKEFEQQSGDSARNKVLVNLYFEFGGLKDEAAFPAALPVWQVASALEGLLKQLTQKLRNFTPSTMRTIVGGLDLLDNLCLPGSKPDLLTGRPFKFLVVDDDLISRQALSLSLKKAFSQPDLAVDGESALAQAARQAYDVIFLDVQMPGMDGFELCTKIRATGCNRNTPVVFVTGHSDFNARAKSTLSGGNDLLGKPFLIFEVTVKALTLALSARLQAGDQKPLAEPEPRREKTNSLAAVTDRPRLAASAPLATRPPHSAHPPDTDAATAVFLDRAAKNIEPLRELCQTMLQAADDGTCQTLLADGFLLVNALISANGAEVMHPAYQMSTALEGLFRKLLQSSKHSTPSALATLVSAVELLNDLCLPGLKADLAVNPPVQLLVVDDDLIARRALAVALQTAFQKPDSAENGETALALASEKLFDVIFLDVQMPGMDGFEVCANIRETLPNRGTPVVFVTGHDDFDARTQMSRNGGNDLMGKPFLTSEITVKALTFALRGRLQQMNALPVA